MFTQLVRSMLTAVSFALLLVPVSASELFKQVRKDFGGVPQGAVVSHTFTLTNTTGAPLHVASLRTSCSVCSTATVSRNHVPAGETAEVNVTVDTNRFAGHKDFTVYVLIDQPYVYEAQLIVSATSRGDLSVQPTKLSFGRVKKGSCPEGTVTIQHYLSPHLKITEVENENGYIQTKVENVSQFSTFV